MPDRIPLLRYEFFGYRSKSADGTYVPAQDGNRYEELGKMLYQAYDSFIDCLIWERPANHPIKPARILDVRINDGIGHVKFTFKCGSDTALTVWHPVLEKHLEIIQDRRRRKFYKKRHLEYYDLDEFDDDCESHACNQPDLNRLIDALAEFEKPIFRRRSSWNTALTILKMMTTMTMNSNIMEPVKASALFSYGPH